VAEGSLAVAADPKCSLGIDVYRVLGACDQLVLSFSATRSGVANVVNVYARSKERG